MGDVTFSKDKLDGVYRCRDIIESDDGGTKITALLSADDSEFKLDISARSRLDLTKSGDGITFVPGRRYRITIEQLSE